MTIKPTPSLDVFATTTRQLREAEPAAAPVSAPKVATAEPPKRRDSVEISDAGRALATSQVTDIRQRVLTGAYDTTQVIDTVARRILQRGDI